MKEDTLVALKQINHNWSATMNHAYGKWCHDLLNLMYGELGHEDKIHLVVFQPAKNRAALFPFMCAESQCVVLNITASAVIRFEMDYNGVTFECGLQGKQFYDTITWDEVMAIEVRNGGWVRYQIPMSPDEVQTMTELLTNVGKVAACGSGSFDLADEPVEKITGNVVQAQFGKKGVV